MRQMSQMSLLHGPLQLFSYHVYFLVTHKNVFCSVCCYKYRRSCQHKCALGVDSMKGRKLINAYKPDPHKLSIVQKIEDDYMRRWNANQALSMHSPQEESKGPRPAHTSTAPTSIHKHQESLDEH